jgi:aryl-alcohol dehydrogenase-like predicted oxidoreductase
MSSAAHADALDMALQLGCNLVDTAATYTGGRSEQLVGAVLARHLDKEVFVMTKAGYGDGHDGKVDHCIAPVFLGARLTRSLERLRRPYVDGFLLHNPERLLTQRVDRDELVCQVETAFGFLEECVAAGRIRYYGVSSNSLAPPEALGLEDFVAAAERVDPHHHFRLVQFPCNLLERTAVENDSGPSLSTRARTAGLVTIANRPLNALVNGRQLRLVVDEAADTRRRAFSDAALVGGFLAAVSERLARLGRDDHALDFPVVRTVAERWDAMDTTDAVNELFGGVLAAFLQRLYDGVLPPSDAAVLEALCRRAHDHARRRMNDEARRMRRQLVDDGVIDGDDERPLELIACEFPIRAGVDHVLVGMRRVQYVERLCALVT